MRYYIYNTGCNDIEYHKPENSDKCIVFKDKFTHFALTSNKGEYYEEGYFQGGPSECRIAGCDVLAESHTEYEFEDDDDKQATWCDERLVIERKRRFGSIKDGLAFHDEEENPVFEFDAKNDEDSCNVFEYFAMRKNLVMEVVKGYDGKLYY